VIALRWTTVVLAFATAGSLAGFGVSARHPDIALNAYHALTGNSATEDQLDTPLQFRWVDHCSIPVVHEGLAFEGGLTSGERVTVRLDTEANTYQFRIEEVWHTGQPARRQSGSMALDTTDCTYVFGNDEAVRVAVNKDGVLLGKIERGGAVPVRIVAFSSVSNRLEDLAGTWSIIGDDGTSIASEEAHVRADGTFSHCSLTHATPMQCAPDTGRIAVINNAFRATDTTGQGGTLVVGKVAGEAVPILLNQGDHLPSMRFLVRRPESVPVADAQRQAGNIPRQHVQIVSPLFHGK
jgi:hypothetical protein